MFFVIKCLHHFRSLGQHGLCLGSSIHEAVDEVLHRLAFDFVMGFESFVRVSSVVQEKRRLSSRRLFSVVVRERGEG